MLKKMRWKAEGLSEDTGAKFVMFYRTLKEARKDYEKEGYKIITIQTKKGIYQNNAFNLI